MRPFFRSFGLVGRIVAILLVVIVVEFTASTFVYERATHFSVRDDEARRLAEHLVIARKLLIERPVIERPDMALELTTERYEVRWMPATAQPQAAAQELDQMRSQILAWEPDLARSDLRLHLLPLRHGSRIGGELRLPDGSQLLFRTQEISQGWSLTIGRVLIALLPAIALLVLGSLMIGRTLRPLRALIDATTRVGLSDHKPVREEGTTEIRSLIHAFNEMQLRIERLIQGRTQALAAVGHDLRTPLARLQLRLDAEGGSPEVNGAMAQDIAEMEAMVASLLAFLGGEDDPEPRVRTDVAVIAATLIDDCADRGHDARYIGPDHLEGMARPLMLKRVLGNLIENAIHYGGNVRLMLSSGPTAVTFCVDDDGPGIPPARIAEVTQPFVRLDEARTRNTRGLGLGLAIVAEAIERESGSFTLSNRPEGGLRAAVTLPL